MGVVYGYWISAWDAGYANTEGQDNNIFLGGPDSDVVVGAFTDGSDLSDSMTGPADLETLWSAISAKLDDIDTAGIAVGGEVGRFRAYGGSGDDAFTLGSTGAWIDAREGHDVIEMTLDGDDTLIGGKGDDTISGGLGADIIDAGRGNDSITFGLGHADIDGGLGADVLDFGGVGGVVLDGATSVWYTDTYTGSVTGVESFGGGGGDDVLAGGGGLRSLFGGGGDDLLDGGNGDDVLDGEEGDDLLVGRRGDDVIKGGLGIDSLSYANIGAAGVTVSLIAQGAQDTGAAGLDRINGVENLLGSAGGNSLTGDNRANQLDGDRGDDALSGGFGDDTLIGGGGVDELVGGQGADRLDGGAGGDTYIWYSLEEGEVGPNGDVIVYLHAADIIDVSSIDADAFTDGDQAFTQVGKHFSGQAGELTVRYSIQSGMTSFAFDVDGDGKADMVIRALGDVGGYDNFAL